MTHLPATIQPESVTAFIDSREQLPLSLDLLRVQNCTLDTGAYSLAGCEHVVRIERKSLDDVLGCVGSQRE